MLYIQDSQKKATSKKLQKMFRGKYDNDNDNDNSNVTIFKVISSIQIKAIKYYPTK